MTSGAVKQQEMKELVAVHLLTFYKKCKIWNTIMYVNKTQACIFHLNFAKCDKSLFINNPCP